MKSEILYGKNSYQNYGNIKKILLYLENIEKFQLWLLLLNSVGNKKIF